MYEQSDIQTVKRAALLLSGLTVYRGVAEDTTVQAFQDLLDELANPTPSPTKILQNYHRFGNLVLAQGWVEHLINLILFDANTFTRQASRGGVRSISPNLQSLAARDLSILQEIACLNSAILKTFALQVLGLGATTNTNPSPTDALAPSNWPLWDNAAPLCTTDATPATLEAAGEAELWLQTRQAQLKQVLATKNWADCVDDIINYHHDLGSGLFARYVAFHWQSQAAGGYLCGIDKPDPIMLDQMIGLHQELEVILENTTHLLKGLPANNLILYGNRGTGKSSVIKALLHAYVREGLRLVELPKSELFQLTQLVQVLGQETQKFIVFIDDLSFDEGEADYKALKTVLEGTLAAKPGNVLIYATSNRRHLIKEFHSDRQENELHVRDGLEEKLSLADRFGITVTFLSPDQNEYLAIVEGLVKQRQLTIDSTELRQMAIRWEMHHNGRSGRTARQFVDHLTATMCS